MSQQQDNWGRPRTFANDDEVQAFLRTYYSWPGEGTPYDECMNAHYLVAVLDGMVTNNWSEERAAEYVDLLSEPAAAVLRAWVQAIDKRTTQTDV